MTTGKRVREVSEAVATLVIAVAICWCLPFVVLASPNSPGAIGVGTVSTGMTSMLDGLQQPSM